jgi:hypothetical protein
MDSSQQNTSSIPQFFFIFSGSPFCFFLKSFTNEMDSPQSSLARKTALELEKIQKILDDNKQVIEQAKANESAGQTEKNEKLLKVFLSLI